MRQIKLLDIMNIKDVIKKHGFTISDVASSLGCSQSALSQSISVNPTYNRMKEIANVLGCNISEFFEDEQSKKIFVCPHCGTRLHITLEEDSKEKGTAATDKDKDAAAINKDKGTAATDSTENASDGEGLE